MSDSLGVFLVIIGIVAVGIWQLVRSQQAQGAGRAKAMKVDIRRSRGFYIRAGVYVVFLVFLYLPILVIGILSFQGPRGGLTFPMEGWSFHWFGEVFDPTYIGDFRMPWVRSVTLAIVVMVLTTIISFLAGLAYRRGFRFSGLIFYLIVASLIAPPFLVSMGIGIGFAKLGLLTSWWSGTLGAHLTWTLPFGVLIMLAVFSRLDRSIEEMARDQGATPWQSMRHVVLPIVLPGMIAVALFGFTLSYDEFPRSSLVTGDGNTLPVEMVAVTGPAARPSLYAVGTMTTIFSLAVIFAGFGAVYLLSRRRASALVAGSVPEGERYGKVLRGGAPEQPAE